MWENCPVTCNILVLITLRVLHRAGWRLKWARWRLKWAGWRWMELGVAGWRWMELGWGGARFSNTHCVKDSSHIQIPMLMSLSMPKCRSWDLRMAVCLVLLVLYRKEGVCCRHENIVWFYSGILLFLLLTLNI